MLLTAGLGRLVRAAAGAALPTAGAALHRLAQGEGVEPWPCHDWPIEEVGGSHE